MKKGKSGLIFNTYSQEKREKTLLIINTYSQGKGKVRTTVSHGLSLKLCKKMKGDTMTHHFPDKLIFVTSWSPCLGCPIGALDRCYLPPSRHDERHRRQLLSDSWGSRGCCCVTAIGHVAAVV